MQTLLEEKEDRIIAAALDPNTVMFTDEMRRLDSNMAYINSVINRISKAVNKAKEKRGVAGP